MIEFHQTVMGRAFYEGTMPRIAKALERIASALEEANKQDIDINASLDAAMKSLAVESFNNIPLSK